MSEKYHTIEGWDQLRGGSFHIHVNDWWLVDDDGNPLFHSKYNSPQCNANKKIVDRLANGRRVQQLPVVYVPVRFQDYAD